MPSTKNRLRHLITVFNAIPSRPATVAFSTPAAAANTIWSAARNPDSEIVFPYAARLRVAQELCASHGVR